MAISAHAELARFAHRDLLLMRIDDEHRVGKRAHALQSTEYFLEALALFLGRDTSFLGSCS